MPLFALKSLSPTFVLEDAAGDHKNSKRAEQFRFSEKAIYFPAFPGTQYLPYSALSHVKTRNTALRVTGTCGKQIPVVCLRLYYDGEETHKDFLFEKPQSVEQVLEAIRECRPELSMDLETRPLSLY